MFIPCITRMLMDSGNTYFKVCPGTDDIFPFCEQCHQYEENQPTEVEEE